MNLFHSNYLAWTHGKADDSGVIIFWSGLFITISAPAICYESLQPVHCESAIKLGAEIYVASVAKSQKGIDKAMSHYPAIASKFSITGSNVELRRFL